MDAPASRFRPFKAGLIVVGVLLAAVVLFGVSNHRRLSTAIDLVHAMGPGEHAFGLVYGANPKCGGDLVSVGFWRHGVSQPEMQGYVCGGVLSKPTIETVPFEEGIVAGLPDV